MNRELTDIIIRDAEKRDVPSMLYLIRELALYEKAPEQVENTIEMMEEEGFGKQPVFHASAAEIDGKVVGVAIYYVVYFTWKGKSVYLDDLVVSEKFRKYGIGKRLFDAVGQFAKSVGANQLRWHVLNWNEPAINFYRKYNASIDPEWITCKLTKEQIDSLF